MATITETNSNYARTTITYTAGKLSNPGPFARFMSWCEGQEKNRLGWLAAALATHGCALTPITLFAIILSGNNIFFWVLALVGMCATLVSNLAAQPTKVTLPIFFASIVLDLALIGAGLVHGFNIAGTYI